MQEAEGVIPAAPCPRCGSYVGSGVTHVCPLPSVSSTIVPGGSIRLTPWGIWEWRPW